MFAPWKVEQLSERRNEEENVIVAMTGREEIKQAQKCWDLA